MNRSALTLLVALLAPSLLSAQALKVGERVPGIRLPSHLGKTTNFPVPRAWSVLAFYPRASTPGCTLEVSSLQKSLKSIEGLGAKVFGISEDDVEANALFATERGLSYPLLCDADGTFSKRYGVHLPKRGIARRVTFIVDSTGTLREVISKVDVRKHGEQVIEALRRLGAAPGGDSGHTGVLDESSFKALHELKQGEAPKLHGAMVELAAGKAYLSLPKNAKPGMPGILLVHEWWGLNDHVKHWADRLAADGYAALAVDLYGGKVATTRDGALNLMRSVNEGEGAAVVAAGLSFLAKDARIKASRRATIGWCFGGGWSLKAAIAHPDLDAAVIYYGRLKTDPAALRPIKARLFGVFGKQDRGIPPSVVDQFSNALREAGVKAEIHSYDAPHAFANPSSARYDEKSAADAWTKVRGFLRSTLRTKPQGR